MIDKNLPAPLREFALWKAKDQARELAWNHREAVVAATGRDIRDCNWREFEANMRAWDCAMLHWSLLAGVSLRELRAAA